MQKRASVFLSHSSTDKIFASKLAERLNRFGLEVWLDKAELRPGDSFEKKILAAIDSVDVLCVIVSPDAATSTWVAKEITRARRRHSQMESIRIIPLIYRPTKIPRSLSDLLFIDFSEGTNFESAVGRLLEACEFPTLPGNTPRDTEIDLQLKYLASSFSLFGALLDEAEESGGIAIAASRALTQSTIPISFMDQFLLLLAMRYPGKVRFGVALTAVELIDETGAGRPALEYCLSSDRLEQWQKNSVGSSIASAKNPTAIVYLHGVFTQHIRSDIAYHTILEKLHKVLMQHCYDDVRGYLFSPNRGPGSYNWDSFFIVMRADPKAVDFKQRVIDWIRNGEFEQPENRITTVAVYRYLNTVEEKQITHLAYLQKIMLDRLRSLLNSSKIDGAILLLTAVCEAEYARLREVHDLVLDRSNSTEAYQWPQGASQIIQLLSMYMRDVQDNASWERRLTMRETIIKAATDGGYATVWSD